MVCREKGVTYCINPHVRRVSNAANVASSSPVKGVVLECGPGKRAGEGLAVDRDALETGPGETEGKLGHAHGQAEFDGIVLQGEFGHLPGTGVIRDLAARAPPRSFSVGVAFFEPAGDGFEGVEASWT